MITVSSAENVLKDVYLGVISNQINNKTNPLFNRIKRSTRNISGKEIRLVAPMGINGGIMAGTETSELPDGVDTPYLSFVAPLKNLYGRFEISDKAIRCSSSDVNSFVNLLQDSMDSLVRASQFNLARMLYGDGTGEIVTMEVLAGEITIDNIEAVAPGMYVDAYYSGSLLAENLLITSVNPITKKITLSQRPADIGAPTGTKLVVHNSLNNEIIGLKGVAQNTTLYGVDRTAYPIINSVANNYNSTTVAFDEEFVQNMIDGLERGGTRVNFINCSYELKSLYQKYLTLYNKNVSYTTLEEGMTVLTHVGIPMVPTNMIKSGECYFLNTDDFTFYELGDWKWLEDESGRVLKQHATKPTYSATLVKYTELICQKPNGLAYCYNLPTTVQEDTTTSA